MPRKRYSMPLRRPTRRPSSGDGVPGGSPLPSAPGSRAPADVLAARRAGPVGPRKRCATASLRSFPSMSSASTSTSRRRSLRAGWADEADLAVLDRSHGRWAAPDRSPPACGRRRPDTARHRRRGVPPRAGGADQRGDHALVEPAHGRVRRVPKPAQFQAPATDKTATTLTRKWTQAVLQELGFGQVQTATAVEIDGKTYPVSHAWGHVPIHLVGALVALDTRTEGVAGAAHLTAWARPGAPQPFRRSPLGDREQRPPPTASCATTPA